MAKSISILIIVVALALALCFVVDLANSTPQGYFSTNAFIASQQRGDNGPQRPSVDPSAYYTGANRAKIARHLANYY